MKRKPAVAGQFYPASSQDLSRQVEGFITLDAGKEDAIGVVSPHAGLIYSGKVAGEVYSRIRIPHTVILIGPNHTGIGRPVSIMSAGSWQIPTGEFSIDEDVAGRLKEKTSLIEEDTTAHMMEHSIEVQLPFIFHFLQDVMIVPIMVMHDSLEICRQVGVAIADVIKESNSPILIVASSDMSHYETDITARRKDNMAIKRILEMDPEGLYSTVINEKISMCGIVPVATMLYAAKRLGAKKSRLVKYMTSGEISGDYGHVVGYAGMIIS
jgi:AmmeMemoRadiSam system protein B